MMCGAVVLPLDCQSGRQLLPKRRLRDDITLCFVNNLELNGADWLR